MKQQSNLNPDAEQRATLQLPQGLPENYSPTAESGLTKQEAERLRLAGKSNRQTQESGKSIPQIVAENLFTLFNLLNFALAICLAFVGSWRNMMFMNVVFANTLIGTVQSVRARAMINKLRLLQTKPAHPIRDGAETDCPPEELVLGDLVVFRAGDQIPADAIVRFGSCAADESLLTGESDPVRREPGQWLMSGSFLTEGKVTAQLACVGDDSYAARLMRDAKRIKSPKSELMTELGRLVAWISRLLVPLGILLFAKEYFLRHAPIDEAIPEAVAAMIGMIPEGLILLTSVALLAGVVKLGRRRTLVQELFGIETLARADVLCLDKTGTLTTGEMTLDKLYPLEADSKELLDAATRFLASFEASSGTLRAMAAALPAAANESVAILPFSSARKKSAASFSDGSVLILGAPSFVVPDRVPPIAEEFAAKGNRVLLLAEANGEIRENELPPVTRLLGLVLLRDTLRPAARNTLKWFREEGVSVRIMSGDDPRTVAAVARALDLPGADRTVDCGKLTDEELCAHAEDSVIFGRLTPDRKRLLVDSMKQAGHCVAMTGDGVNDIPSLKASDCSIAISGGAEATEHAAQLVLLDGDFNALPAVVAEGRRVIANITRTASLFLVKTLYSFFLRVIFLVIPLRYPFQPIQLTLISALCVGIPSFFLALEPCSERARGSFLKRILCRAAPGAVGVTVCSLVMMIQERFGVSYEAASTMAALSAGVISLGNLYLTCRPFTKLRAALCCVMTVGFVGVILIIPKVFYLHTELLTGQNFWILAGVTALGTAILLIGTKLLRPVLDRLK